MLHDPLFLIVAAAAVILVGLAKGGLSGLGALGTPLLALVVAPVQAAAILLPILIVQDVVSVWSFRRTWDGWVIGWMLPGALAGIALGWAFAEVLPVQAVMAMLGAITAGFGLWRLWIERGGRAVAASRSPGWVGSLFGVGMGFASQIAHAGGPPFQMWVAPRKLPHERFVGTGAILFAIVNWAKVPAYLALGAFDATTLATSATLLPLAIASTLAGVWVIRRMSPQRFYVLVYLLMVLLGAKLVWDAIG
ncbi:sulfite exporter TauE/SafE family protein [Sphingomonas sp. A2-49]|uniref:sulfite exporter TauE/SafE family protein n=1 Tax=Sphingomonas sp. A2-49 TaxID=1391375 RepID=UPI0021D00EB1|nr:sulfite exporter TauE/SafE family protein [Sphingomonas sp. A2-49]MCU6454449.1 sulfite exporter TauE/SafE family protein [Sphingomonas sp. A2-49]